MAFHRDIFWLGRQWTVTGFGLQAVDQKLDMRFDIPISRIWDEKLESGLLAEKWFDEDDFSKGLEVARKRFRETPNVFQQFESEK